MGDPLTVLGFFVASMQFVLQLKTYLHERKQRKKQEQEPIYQQQQHPYNNIMHASSPFPAPITYCICYQYIYPPLYNLHVQYYMPLNVPPAPHFSHQYPPAPASFSRSLPSDMAQPSSSSSLISDASCSPSYDWLGLLGGRMELLHHQQAPHNIHHLHEPLGMRTGACAYNDRNSSYGHWKSLKEEITSCEGKQRSIAVVDWSKGNIDMFMEIGGAYFRNYRISGCDVVTFAHLFKEREVFTGEIKDKKLERFSKEMKMVDMRGAVQSTNSWMSLGIYEESEAMQEVLREQGSSIFIQTVRGAVFGLVCCVYEAPSDLNVDMESPRSNYAVLGHHHLDIVRINTHCHPCHIMKRPSCFFSVFSFGDHGWASQDILLG